MKNGLKTDEVIARLSNKFCQPTYAFMTQVRNGAGFSATRTMDAMAMSLWPSRGLHITGFEVKVSRGDFLSELKNPAKADELACFCDYWYLVVGDPAIVQNGDLPPTWGLIVPSGKGLKILKEAPKLKAQPIDNSLLAAVMKNLTKGVVKRDLIKAELDAAVESGKQSGKWIAERAEKDKAELEKKISEFEKISGVKLLHQWRWGDVGAAVEEVISGRHTKSKEELKRIRERVERLLKYIDGDIAHSYQI